MLRELFYKWFGLEYPSPCATCEVLREQLHRSEAERKELLHKLLDRDVKSEPVAVREEEYKPVQPQFIPWRVRQQMFEAEDRKRAQLTKSKAEEIENLEKELGVK